MKKFLADFQRNSRIGISLGGGRVMNKYKVIYYMSVLVLIVNAFAMVGTLLGWFYFVESKYLFWINLVLLSIFNWLKKKEKNDEQV